MHWPFRLPRAHRPLPPQPLLHSSFRLPCVQMALPQRPAGCSSPRPASTMHWPFRQPCAHRRLPPQPLLHRFFRVPCAQTELPQRPDGCSSPAATFTVHSPFRLPCAHRPLPQRPGGGWMLVAPAGVLPVDCSFRIRSQCLRQHSIQNYADRALLFALGFPAFTADGFHPICLMLTGGSGSWFG
jgi:hypothetical protein